MSRISRGLASGCRRVQTAVSSGPESGTHAKAPLGRTADSGSFVELSGGRELCGDEEPTGRPVGIGALLGFHDEAAAPIQVDPAGRLGAVAVVEADVSLEGQLATSNQSLSALKNSAGRGRIRLTECTVYIRVPHRGSAPAEVFWYQGKRLARKLRVASCELPVRSLRVPSTSLRAGPASPRPRVPASLHHRVFPPCPRGVGISAPLRLRAFVLSSVRCLLYAVFCLLSCLQSSVFRLHYCWQFFDKCHNPSK